MFVKVDAHRFISRKLKSNRRFTKRKKSYVKDHFKQIVLPR